MSSCRLCRAGVATAPRPSHVIELTSWVIRCNPSSNPPSFVVVAWWQVAAVVAAGEQVAGQPLPAQRAGAR